MRTQTLARVFTALLVATMTVACSKSSTGPSGPSVDGVWVGTWGTTAIRLSLHQSGSSVTGELEVGPATYALTGDVDDAGAFSWSSELNETTCSAYSSSRFQLQDAGDAMAGTMRRARRQLPCGSFMVEPMTTKMQKIVL